MLAGFGESVLDPFRQSSYTALRDLRCELREGVLTLQGCLPTYHLKQIAQKLAVELEGVREVINQIEVKGQTHRDCGR